ncbi:Hint domain-containing protein [Algicella marina]|uniref:Type I secretion protein n=1 Tax=Algicella marina TaxID=2683284 RepID=A0A6P1SU26_9RHOB|nr:Hint domain-containing protein [Algicella marina]QHQ33928.1 type I secretion protein [Algicella marina]
MAGWAFYKFEFSGQSGDGHFQPPAIFVPTDSHELDAATLEGTPLEDGICNGIATVPLGGVEYELARVTLGGDEYYADSTGTDLAALGLLPGSADMLAELEEDGAFSDAAPVAVCFARGTLITTPDGPVPVEDLAIGDAVTTLDEGPLPICWIGSNTVRARGSLRPVCISAGALGPGAPSQDLIVSPRHRVVIRGWRAEVLFGQEEVLATAESLINDDTIRPVPDVDTIDYFHILFDTHQIILSNDTASESFNPSSIALQDCERHVRDEIYALFPELRESPRSYGKTARMVVTGKEARLIAE